LAPWAHPILRVQFIDVPRLESSATYLLEEIFLSVPARIRVRDEAR
jgi:hypothetical protein